MLALPQKVQVYRACCVISIYYGEAKVNNVNRYMYRRIRTHLLHLLTERSTVARSILSGDADLLGSLRHFEWVGVEVEVLLSMELDGEIRLSDLVRVFGWLSETCAGRGKWFFRNRDHQINAKPCSAPSSSLPL